MGGATSIDVTRPGIDKAYGIGKLRDTLRVSLKDMVYIGDALFPGGNDYPAEQVGVVSIPVKGPDDTKRGHQDHPCLPGRKVSLANLVSGRGDSMSEFKLHRLGMIMDPTRQSPRSRGRPESGCRSRT